MIEVAEELIKAVYRWEELVAVAQMVLAELTGGVALGLEQLGDGWVFLLQADVNARHADLREAGADWVLTGDEAGSAGGAALLRIVVGEKARPRWPRGRCWGFGIPSCRRCSG